MEFGAILMYVISYFGLFTAIFFLLTLFENKDKIASPRPRAYPTVTVVVPAYNEQKTIAKTLKSLVDLDYPKDKLTIMVVDDGSKDRTYEISKNFERFGVKVFRKENGGKASALNFALRSSDSDLFAALDADSFASSQALKEMVGYFEDKNVMAVTPSLKVHDPKNTLQRIQYVEYLIGIFLRKVFAFLGSIHVTPGPLTIYRKSFFDKYGGYDEHNLTEDIEIALRIQEKNYIIENSVSASVFTVSPKKFKPLLKQRLRWYIGFTENVMNYRGLFHPKHGNLGLFVLPASFFSVLLVLITLFYTSYKIVTRTIIQNYQNLASINFEFWRLFQNMSFDTFYMGFNSLTVLSLCSLFLGIGIVVIAKRLSKEKTKIRFFYFLYLIVYWALFGFWWLFAGIYTFLGKKVSWGARSAQTYK